MNRDPRLEFYLGDGVRKFIRRYPLEEEEKRLLELAARSVGKGRINQELIDKADELVRRVRTEREPLRPIALEILRENADDSPRRFAERGGGKRGVALGGIFALVAVGIYFLTDSGREEPQGVRTSAGRDGELLHAMISAKKESGKNRLEKVTERGKQRAEDPIPRTLKILPAPEGKNARRYDRCSWKRGEWNYSYRPVARVTQKECMNLYRHFQNWERVTRLPQQTLHYLGEVKIQTPMPRKVCRMKLYENPIIEKRFVLLSDTGVCRTFQ